MERPETRRAPTGRMPETISGALRLQLRLFPAPDLPRQVSEVGADTLVVHPQALPVAGMFWAIGRGQAEALVRPLQGFPFRQ